jgi:hypothetical protein
MLGLACLLGIYLIDKYNNMTIIPKPGDSSWPKGI